LRWRASTQKFGERSNGACYDDRCYDVVRRVPAPLTLARAHARTLLISLARLTFCREAHEAEIARLQREIDSNKEALARKDRELEDERARVRAQLNRYVVLTGCSID